MKTTLVWCSLCLWTGGVAAQQERVSVTHDKPRVAILPFDAQRVGKSQVFDRDGVAAFAEAATQKVLNAFVEMQRFTVIERSAIDKVLKEQDFQMGESTDDATIANIGNLLGTQYIVHGQIQNVTTSKKDKKFRATVQMHLRVIDVSSGEVKFSRDVEGRSDAVKQLTSKIGYDALNATEVEIGRFVRLAFPVEGKVVKILEDEGSSKKNKEKKSSKTYVLVSCGKSLGVRAGDKFHVVTEESYDVDGRAFTRQKSLARIKVLRLEVDGIFSVCEVTDGVKAVKTALEGGQELKVISAD